MKTNGINRANAQSVRNIVNNFNMGFSTRGEYAAQLSGARAPYVGRVRGLILYVIDRWF